MPPHCAPLMKGTQNPTLTAYLFIPSSRSPLLTLGARLSLDCGAGGIGFVENAICAGCHEAQFAEWRTSHHAHSMERATPATVRGDLNNVHLITPESAPDFFAATAFLPEMFSLRPPIKTTENKPTSERPTGRAGSFFPK